MNPDGRFEESPPDAGVFSRLDLDRVNEAHRASLAEKDEKAQALQQELMQLKREQKAVREALLDAITAVVDTLR